MSNYTLETLPDIISAAVLKEYLGISRAGAYNILNSRGFPTLIIGNRKLVMKKDLLKWLEKHKQSGI